MISSIHVDSRQRKAVYWTHSKSLPSTVDKMRCESQLFTVSSSAFTSQVTPLTALTATVIANRSTLYALHSLEYWYKFYTTKSNTNNNVSRRDPTNWVRQRSPFSLFLASFITADSKEKVSFTPVLTIIYSLITLVIFQKI